RASSISRAGARRSEALPRDRQQRAARGGRARAGTDRGDSDPVSDARESASSPLFEWQRAAAAAALAGRARWPHALLLEGRRGIGKRALALHYAQALLCETPQPEGGPCGQCTSCNYVRAGTHPDLRLIEPIERDEDGNETPLDEIVVDRIRELIE